MTELEMIRAAVAGRQYKLEKEFSSEEERLIYISSMISQSQWALRDVYEKVKFIPELDISYTVYCVRYISVM